MNLLYFTIIIPLFSFFVLAFLGRRWRPESVAVVGVCAIGLVCLLATLISIDFYSNIQPDNIFIYTRFLWQWFTVGDFTVPISLSLDGLSLIFLLLISFVSFFAHFYAASYVDKKQFYTFFAYGNLLVGSMLLLVLADNLFVMLLGWEGVSLCSYLLVSFHYKQLKSSYSATRTFIVMHISDVFLLIGLFLIYDELHSFNIRELLTLAVDQLAIDSEIIFWITVMLFLGAIGKSVQFPMQTWQSDAIAAPMPALTLINASGTVLAGIYLISRLNPLFTMSSDTFLIIGIVASLTILFASCVALVQNDVKRIVSFIALSQLSYTFIAIAVKAWELALIYLINYVAVIALLFLTTASLIQACNGERDITRMGGLCRKLPVIYSYFIIVAASLVSLPWLVAGFFTKSDIIGAALAQDRLGLASIGLLGILLSTFCILRFLFIVFHGKTKLSKVVSIPKICYIPLFILALFSVSFIAYIRLPINGIFPTYQALSSDQLPLQLLLAAVSILGILVTYMLYAGKNAGIHDIANTPLSRKLIQLWYPSWRVESFYNIIFVTPYLKLARLVHRDPLALWVNSVAWSINRVNARIVLLENGQLRWYIMSIVGGGLLILLLLLFM